MGRMSLRKRIIGAVDECAIAEDLGILCHAIIWVFSASLLGVGQEGEASEIYRRKEGELKRRNVF